MDKDLELKTLIIKVIKEEIPKILRSSGFTDRKITDTPTDALAVVSRKYVQLNGSVAGRPVSSVATIGQFYLDTNSNQVMWKVAAGWVNGVASVVAQNN